MSVTAKNLHLAVQCAGFQLRYIVIYAQHDRSYNLVPCTLYPVLSVFEVPVACKRHRHPVFIAIPDRLVVLN
jgi:hypothetical protein